MHKRESKRSVCSEQHFSSTYDTWVAPGAELGALRTAAMNSSAVCSAPAAGQGGEVGPRRALLSRKIQSLRSRLMPGRLSPYLQPQNTPFPHGAGSGIKKKRGTLHTTGLC